MTLDNAGLHGAGRQEHARLSRKPDLLWKPAPQLGRPPRRRAACRSAPDWSGL